MNVFGGEFAATAEIESVYASAQVESPGLHAVPSEHTHAALLRGLALAIQRLNLSIRTYDILSILVS